MFSVLGLNTTQLQRHTNKNPPVSQDFNAIENAWALLKDRLQVTLPIGVERREKFLVRLGEVVSWDNRNKAKEHIIFSRNQKQRSKDCLAGKPPGSRTKW